MCTIKSQKEIQLAAMTYLRAFVKQRVESVDGHFFPADPSFLYKKQQRTLAYFLGMAALSLFVILYTLLTEVNFYAQLDPLVAACVGLWLFLIGITAWLFKQYRAGSRHLEMVLNDPKKASFGVLITEEYYFERLPDYFHIIPKANIVRIDYEETRDNGEQYLELLLDLGEEYEIRGILYRPEEYDIKAWLGEAITSEAIS